MLVVLRNTHMLDNGLMVARSKIDSLKKQRQEMFQDGFN